MTEVRETIKNGYVVIMSVGPEVKIDEEELPLIYKAVQIKERLPVQLKQGIIVNKFIVGVYRDKDRVIIEKLDAETGQRTTKLQPIQDIFKDIKQLSDKKLLEQ